MQHFKYPFYNNFTISLLYIHYQKNGIKNLRIFVKKKK
jgi:hypothetical protein